MQNLKLHWLLVLELAARAVADAVESHTLAAEEGRMRVDRLRAERAWAETFTWPAG